MNTHQLEQDGYFYLFFFQITSFLFPKRTFHSFFSKKDARIYVEHK